MTPRVNSSPRDRRGEAQEMTDYRYKIGQKVFIRGPARIDAPRGAYQILERLPARNDRLRYLIRSLQDINYKTIVDETNLA
jgi:hypothetical protein